MKKYPITYKGELYEVRWENLGWLPAIIIYKETTSKFLKRKVYKEIYCEYEYNIDKHIKNNQEDDPNYYIEQAKTIFKLWERDIAYKTKSKIIEQNKRQALTEWDGIIE